MIGKLTKYAVAVLLCAVFSAGALQAASFTFSGQSKEIKAGVLLPSDPNPDPLARPNPYAFYIMDQRDDIKPAGWDFYNPLAPSHVTQEIYNRWVVGAAPSNFLTGARYALGERVTKEMGCYWGVRINVPPDDLAQFDVLLLTRYGLLSFGRKERETLRKFVDNGGVLWIEYREASGFSGTQLDESFFIRGLRFLDGGPGLSKPAVVSDLARAHSLVNRPFLLLWHDVAGLGTGDPVSGGKVYTQYDWGVGPQAGWYFSTIVARAGKPIVSAAQYGSGYVLVTAESVGQAISQPVGYRKDDDGKYDIGRCGELFAAAQPEDLKCAYNIVSWGSEHATVHKSARHTGYSFAEIGAPLTLLWEFIAQNPAPTSSSPAILDDMVFYVDGENVLRAFDLSPIRDRDGDGDPDDGIPDYSLGAPYDELWNHSLGAPASPVTAAYVPLGGGQVVPTVFVVTESGAVYGFDASVPDPAPVPFFADPQNALQAFPSNTNIPAPTYVDGTLYVGGGFGELHAHSFFGGSGDWTHPKTPTLAGPANSPTVGYFYDSTSGATEQVVYDSLRGLPGQADGMVRSYPIKVFNEVLRRMNPGVSPPQFRIRSFNSYILEGLGKWHLDKIDATGIPQPVVDAVVLNPGRFQVNDPLTGNETIIADYELDWANLATTQSYRSIPIHLPSVAATGIGIVSAPAASKKDILYFAASSPAGNASLYAVKETGQPEQNQTPLVVKWRWCFEDAPARQFLGAVNPLPVGSPAVANDMVYLAVNDGNQGYILAFSADPKFVIKVGTRIRRGKRVVVRQYDSVRPEPPQPIEYTGTVTGAQDSIPRYAMFLIDYEGGELTFVNFRNRAGDHYLSASHDLTVVYTPETELEGQESVETTLPCPAFSPRPNDRWNNLVWFMRLRNPRGGAPLPVTSSPMVMGDILYVGCADGVLCGLDLAKIGNVGPAHQIPWNPSYAWADKIVPGSDPALTDILATVAGSHGMLAVPTPKGLAILYNPVTLAADGNRLVEVTSGGITWSCDTTTTFTRTAKASQSTGPGELVYGSVKTPFNRPAVARRASVGGIIVADTGNNRVVHIDKSGTVLWQITDFVDPDDPANPNDPLLPPGSPLTLNRPTDVSMWAMKEDPADPNSRPEYHYLIADSGNYRVLEIVAKFDPTVNAYRNVLRWASQTLAQGKQYRYASARPVYTPQPAVICAVSNYDSSQGGLEGSGGALVKLNWSSDPATSGLVDEVITELVATNPPVNVKLVNPSFFNRQYISNTEYYDVAIDATGIYLLHSSGGEFSIRSYRISDHRSGATLIPLSPCYAQILPNGHVIVTNKATGTVGGTSFFGEVFELQPSLRAGNEGKFETVGMSILGLRQPSSAERQIY